MEIQWRRAVQRLIVSNLGRLDQDEVDAWFNEEVEVAPLLEPALKAISQHRDMILREMHQIYPAEIDFLVADAWQGKGIGTFLMQMLVKVAKSRDIKGLTAEVLRDNVAKIALMHKSGVPTKSMPAGGSYIFTMDF